MNDEYLIYGETLKSIADSIRSVSSVNTTWTPDEMAAYILANLVKPTTRQAAKTYTPGTSNQTIPAGTFLTGAATIAGDADLAAANIVKGKNIFNVAGSASGIWGTPDTFYGFTAVKSGSFTTPASYQSSYTITHNLGSIPRFIMYSSPYSKPDYGIVWGGILFTTNGVSSFNTNTVSGDYGIALSIFHYSNDYYQLSADGLGVNSVYKEKYGDPMNNNLEDSYLRGFIVNPTSTTFTIKSNTTTNPNGLHHNKATTYNWLAMA